MSPIDLFNGLLETGTETVPFSFLATGEIDGRMMAFRVDRDIRIPTSETSEPLASGLFMTGGEYFEKDFRMVGGRVFEPFEAAAPNFREREAYGVAKLRRILSWQEEPSAGGAAHPLCRLAFLPDVFGVALDRVLAPNWTIQGEGPVWQVAPFYAHMAPPPGTVKGNRFIGGIKALPPIMRRRISRTDSETIFEAAQTAFERETMIINGRLWRETPPPFIRVNVPLQGQGKVSVDFIHDEMPDESESAPLPVAFDISDEAGALAFAEKVSAVLGVGVKRRGRADWVNDNGFGLSDTINLAALAGCFVDVAIDCAYQFPASAVALMYKLNAVADRLAGVPSSVMLPEQLRGLPLEKVWLPLWKGFNAAIPGSIDPKGPGDEAYLRFARVNIVAGILHGIEPPRYGDHYVPPVDGRSEFDRVGEAMLATRELLTVGGQDFAYLWSSLFGPEAEKPDGRKLDVALEAAELLPGQPKAVWQAAIGKLKAASDEVSRPSGDSC